MLDFLGSLSQYEDFPENLSYSYFKKLSTIIQDVILEKLEEIEDLDLQFRIHKNLCYIIKNMFAKRQAWHAFKWTNASVTKMQLSDFLDNK